MPLRITMLCYYPECHILFNIMLNVVMLSVIVLSVVAPFGEPLMTSLILGSKARSLSYMVHLTLVGSSKILDQTGKECHGQTREY